MSTGRAARNGATAALLQERLQSARSDVRREIGRAATQAAHHKLTATAPPIGGRLASSRRRSSLRGHASDTLRRAGGNRR